MAQPQWTPLVKGEERDVRQVAAYAAGRFSLTDALTAIVGARVTDWKNTDQLVPANTYERRGRTTPYAGLILDVDDHHSLYASYTGIFKPQNNRDRSGRYLAPLEGNSYEVGAKGEYLGGQLNAALALFRIEQDNLAVNDPGQLVPGTTNQAFLAAKGTVSQGWNSSSMGSFPSSGGSRSALPSSMPTMPAASTSIRPARVARLPCSPVGRPAHGAWAVA